MSKIKIVLYLIIIFAVYKGYEAFRDFEIGVGDRVAKIEELAGFVCKSSWKFMGSSVNHSS